MLTKLHDIWENDALLLHKVGIIVGAIIGVLFGMIVSAEADKYETMEVNDGPQTDERQPTAEQ